MNRHRKYLCLSAGLTLAWLAAVAGFNVAVDPYRVFRIVENPSLATFREKSVGRVGKAEAARRSTADVCLIGDSRMYGGISPDFPELTRCGVVEKFAVPGCTSYESVRMIELIQSSRSPSLILWAMDPETLCLLPIRHATPECVTTRLNPDLSVPQYLQHHLVSPEVLVDSAAVLVRAATTPGEGRVHDGRLHFIDDVENEPKPARIRYAHSVLDAWTNWLIYAKDFGSTPDEGIRSLRPHLEHWRRRGSRIVLAMPPMHAMVHATHLRSAFGRSLAEASTRKLVACIEDINAGDRNLPPIELWSFREFSEWQCAWNPEGDASLYDGWFDDPLHLRVKLGRRMIRRILNSKFQADRFGVRLTAANVDDYLSRLRTQLAEYERSAPRQMELIARVEAENPGPDYATRRTARSRKIVATGILNPERH